MWIGIPTGLGVLVFALSLIPPVIAGLVALGVLLMLPGILYAAYRVLLALYIKLR